MSQKKVDYYKEQKANRAKIIRKEKTILAIEKCIALLVFVAAVCWIGYSVYARANAGKASKVETKETVMNTSALDDYINEVNSAASELEDTDAESADETVDVEDADAEETAEAEDAEATEAEPKEAEAEETDAEETAETEETEEK